MKGKFYHNICSVSFAQRESFNNTIILLTFVKNKYYYITGFSRLRHCIEIGFDFESDLHGSLSEFLTVDFSSDEEHIVIDSQLQNICFDDPDDICTGEYRGVFSCADGRVGYRYKIKKDDILPISSENMNRHILAAKGEIIKFLEENYRRILS